MTNIEMFRRWLLSILVVSCVASVICVSPSTTIAPDKKSKSEGVQFKTSFPFGDGSQYYGASPYGYPQTGYYGNSGPYYGQSGPVSYPSYSLPQQSYTSYPYNTYGSYQPYQSMPYGLSSQYGIGSYQYPMPSDGIGSYQYAMPSDGIGSYQYAMPSGFPTNVYPASSGSVSYLPENTGTSDLLKMLSSSNVLPSSHSITDANSVFPFDSNQQKLSNFYLPQVRYGSNGAQLGGYPSNNYDPFANIPVEIIDVDYTGGFKTAGASTIPKNTKPIIKVTSHSDSNGASVQPIVQTQSSVVTMRPQHTVITRTYDSTKDGPTVNVENITNETDGTDDVANETDDDTTTQDESNDIPDKTSAKGDEEPSDVSSWFK